jgi:hypothetical protein
MSTTFDPNLFTQIGLDSGALTMLGVVVHTFGEPGEYRGTVRRDQETVATFYVSVDKACAVADVKIDLAELASPANNAGGCCRPEDGPRFVVHPRGYAVFHVSSGAGGYAVNVRRADEDPELKAYDSRVLEPGDIFSAVLMRPGRYAIRNELSDADAEVTVAYPVIGRVAYRPPPPQEVECGETIEPRRIELQPVQGLNFRVRAPARIRIELLEPYDGPGPAAG